MNKLESFFQVLNNLEEPFFVLDLNLNIIKISSNAKSILNIDKNVKKLGDVFDDKNLNKFKKSCSVINDIQKSNFHINIQNQKILLKSSLINLDNKPHNLILIKDNHLFESELKLTNCIFKISEASHYVDNLDELYSIIHKILSKVVYTENFYIAIVDNKNDVIHFPYFIDKYDPKPKSRKISNGLTEYVCKTGESILVNPEQNDSFIKNKKMNINGSKSVDWLGVPLKNTLNETFGALVVQSYDKNIRFTEKDQNILEFVSHQIAMAIKRKMDRQEIEQKAYYDQTTGLTNKLLFNDRLEQSMHDAKRHNTRTAILFLDLDNFKYVNDTMGHSAGDKLLKIVSKRLKSSLRKTDTIARWGGDEFTVILPKIKNTNDIRRLCKRILNEDLTNVVVDNKELRITASIGIAIYPEDGLDIETLTKNADTAMYKAKDSGKNQYKFFKPLMNKEITERFSNESNLFKAIEKEEFLLLFQPQIDLETNEITGFESLVRWNSPGKGILPPYQFIPIAEETDLIIPLGEWILRETCKQNKIWHEKGHRLTCAVNISAKQFLKYNLADIVKNILHETGLDPEFLELELTETILMKDLEKTIRVLKRLKEMGVKISIDDFGTGYSSLSYLKQFPIDTLKIDQSFISSINNDLADDNLTIANIVIDLGHKLGLKVIAEGVETEKQVEFLKKYACDKIQGYLISEPVNEIEFNLLLK